MLDPTMDWSLVEERRYLALRVGVGAAAASVAPSFGRGLLPRSATDQAMVTGACAAYSLGAASLSVATVQAVAELIVTSRGSGTSENMLLVASGVVGLCGGAVIKAVPDDHTVPMTLAVAQSGAWVVTGGALATALVIVTDKAMGATVGRRGLATHLAVAVGMGAGASMVRVWMRNRRARIQGEGATRDRKSMVAEKAPMKVARAAAAGVAAAGAIVTLAGTQFAIAEGVPRLVARLRGRPRGQMSPVVGHAVAAGMLSVGGVMALNRLRLYTMHADDVIEPAYPDPPTNPHVTAGPSSVVAFDAIGKEGRRFVLMTLTPEEISEVMGERAVQPIRAVAGFASADKPEERALIAMEELERLGAFERSTIVVAAPTGVGYVNYSFAEAFEYLTRGDCAIIVPQYALVPSALALNLTQAGIAQQTLILSAIRERLAQIPEDRRPRVLQFGESLGAQVALDVAADGTSRFTELGVEGGLYLGTPFRATLWDRWFNDPATVDPHGLLGQVAQASEIADLPASVRHVQIIHDDDPITKFAYSIVVRAPWWMGPPATRPPGVPRETAWLPVVTLIITLVDVKNGMDSQPGEFVRRGHDYRIELCEAVRSTFRLTATDEQAELIEQALRDREREWATRRMVATRFAKARESVLSQLSRWGIATESFEFDEQTASALARGEMPERTRGPEGADHVGGGV